MEGQQFTLTIKEDTEQIGGVPLDSLALIVDHLRKLVDEVSEVVGEHYGVRTGTQLVLTDLRRGSAVLQLAAIPRTVHLHNISGPVVTATTQGLAMLDHASERPPFFSDRALTEATKLVRPLKQQIRTITVAANASAIPDGEPELIHEIFLTPKIQSHVRELLTPRHVYRGSVEGRIFKLEKKTKRLECTLYDRVRRQAITCWVPTELEDQAQGAFNARVLIAGRLFADKRGRVQRVDMEALRLLRNADEQPPLGRLFGSAPNFTGGVDAVEYVRAVRDERTTAN